MSHEAPLPPGEPERSRTLLVSTITRPLTAMLRAAVDGTAPDSLDRAVVRMSSAFMFMAVAALIFGFLGVGFLASLTSLPQHPFIVLGCLVTCVPIASYFVVMLYMGFGRTYVLRSSATESHGPSLLLDDAALRRGDRLAWVLGLLGGAVMAYFVFRN